MRVLVNNPTAELHWQDWCDIEVDIPLSPAGVEYFKEEGCFPDDEEYKVERAIGNKILELIRQNRGELSINEVDDWGVKVLRW